MPKFPISTNFAVRHSRGTINRKLDQRLIYSKFCCIKIFRDNYHGISTCCDFYGSDRLVIGSLQGEVKLLNIHDGTEVASHQCHEDYVSGVRCSRKNNLLLTYRTKSVLLTSVFDSPFSTCWSLKNSKFTNLFDMKDEYIEFSKLSEDKIIGTKNVTASIYDIRTCQLLMSLTPRLSNQYTNNRATFSPRDDLVLSDGVLWDINSGKEIYKFDKVNETLNGIFHPNGREIISDMDIWDVRMFHLIQTVPSLHESEVIFSPVGFVLYSMDSSQVATSVNVLDSFDYSEIGTININTEIVDLSCNKRNTQVVLVEHDAVTITSDVKIYNIGSVGILADELDEMKEEEKKKLEQKLEDYYAYKYPSSDSGSDYQNCYSDN